MGAIPWAPQFGNGDTAAKALMIDFDGLGHYLQPSAAISLRALAREFESVFGVPFTISEAFRDIPTQNYFWNLYQSGKGNPAAFPGTSSHGQGLAVDINSWVYGNRAGTDRHNWLVNNAGRFGWSWYLVGKPSGEPWHFNYVGGWTDWAADNTFEEDDMPYTKDELRDIAREGGRQAVVDVFFTKTNGMVEPLLDILTGRIKAGPGQGSDLYQAVVGRLDQVIAPIARLGAVAYRVDGTPGQRIINLENGADEHLSGEDRERMVALGLLAKQETVVSQEQFDFLRKLAETRRNAA